MRKTKIVCTIGPASDDEGILRRLLLSGMNVARLNFSHGTHEEQLKRVELIKKLRTELDIPVALLLDTKGPEIRTGLFEGGACLLEEDQEVTISHDDVTGTAECFSISYKSLSDDVNPDDIILIDDGLVELRVKEVVGKDVICTVVSGGPVSDRKGVNLPGIKVNLPALTEKDLSDIQFAIENDFDFIAMSFVRKAADVDHVRHQLDKNNGSQIHIISKIENQEGVDNFEEILDASDGIMVARGDLGVEIPPEQVPNVQKRLIRRCYSKGKPCITATQMLDSMIRNPRPTRAEVSDVANAILDGTSAVMLSGETAAGRYPVEALQMMGGIAEATEQSVDFWDLFKRSDHSPTPSVANAVSYACCTTAMDLKAKVIVAVTFGGRTARLIARFRPACPIVAPTVSERNRRQLNLSWGVVPVLIDEVTDTDALFDMGMEAAVSTGLVDNGDVVIISGGTPVGISGMTNTLKVQMAGHMLCQGTGINRGQAAGDVVFANSTCTLDDRSSCPEHIVLVVEDTDNDMLGLLRMAEAVVAETADPECHAVTVGKLLNIPVVYNCKNATKILREGMAVIVDSDRGLVK